MFKYVFPLWFWAAATAVAQPSLDYPSVWQCDTNKFNWYCDVEDEPFQSSQPQAIHKPNPLKPIPLKDIQTAAQLRQELKRLEDIAVMDPTDQHIKDYLTLWQWVQTKGAIFSDRWRRVVWQNPHLDYAQKRPVNHTGIKIQDEDRLHHQEQQLRHLSKSHGLIFFFQSNCPYCHAMATTLKLLSEKYGIEVLGVSIDGGRLPEFPSPRDGRTQAATWGIERVPALFIGSKQTGDHVPIGFGMMALSEIIHRIFILTGTQVGDTF